MRAALAFAIRRGLARAVLGVGMLGLVWAGLHETFPWAEGRGGAQPAAALRPFPASSWDLPVAAAVLVFGVALSVLIYRRRSTNPLEPSEQAAILRGDERP